jgi:hypothetical protein
MLFSRLAETAEAFKVEPMIAQMHRRVAVSEFFQTVEAGFRASDRPARRGKLASQIPIAEVRVLGMGREPCGGTKLTLARHRCRRVRGNAQPACVFTIRSRRALAPAARDCAKVAGELQYDPSALEPGPQQTSKQRAEPAQRLFADIPADNGCGR